MQFKYKKKEFAPENQESMAAAHNKLMKLTAMKTKDWPKKPTRQTFL
ncbi:hypothetical protein Cabys_2260 [Caldithrix abyssi DSM 13497]|uniref:Uncharacterized protein n=1 Tax=Caldithrix abyssi DSM 13497 TaxID=880073 RepID=A0A1J1C9P0_CALAY|nr:hypothetical protein Cabys_2260 [Caldithrix abyssi DSM 13497]